MSRILTVLGAQVRPVAFDPDATLDKFEDEVQVARKAFGEADLLLFPELYLTGDDPFSPQARSGFEGEVAEKIPGPLTERVGKIAARARRWICAGSIFERGSKGSVHNTAIVFDAEGHLVATYRKLFPWQPFETSTPGTRQAPVFEIPGTGRVGLMICYDGWFPEVARGLALQGAELLLHPTLTTTPDREQELVLARANAIANQCYVLNVNAVPSIGGGRSIGVDPEGRVLFELGQREEFVLEALDLDRVTHVRRHGTRGLNRVLQHVEAAPKAVFEPYRRLLRRR
ncbi:MAG: carbon-nitrogen hydrolase family protein [Actinomycetota bacterium]